MLTGFRFWLLMGAFLISWGQMVPEAYLTKYRLNTINVWMRTRAYIILYFAEAAIVLAACIAVLTVSPYGYNIWETIFLVLWAAYAIYSLFKGVKEVRHYGRFRDTDELALKGAGIHPVPNSLEIRMLLEAKYGGSEQLAKVRAIDANVVVVLLGLLILVEVLAMVFIAF